MISAPGRALSLFGRYGALKIMPDENASKNKTTALVRKRFRPLLVDATAFAIVLGSGVACGGATEEAPTVITYDGPFASCPELAAPTVVIDYGQDRRLKDVLHIAVKDGVIVYLTKSSGAGDDLQALERVSTDGSGARILREGRSPSLGQRFIVDADGIFYVVAEPEGAGQVVMHERLDGSLPPHRLATFENSVLLIGSDGDDLLLSPPLVATLSKSTGAMATAPFGRIPDSPTPNSLMNGSRIARRDGWWWWCDANGLFRSRGTWPDRVEAETVASGTVCPFVLGTDSVVSSGHIPFRRFSLQGKDLGTVANDPAFAGRESPESSRRVLHANEESAVILFRLVRSSFETRGQYIDVFAKYHFATSETRVIACREYDVEISAAAADDKEIAWAETSRRGRFIMSVPH